MTATLTSWLPAFDDCESWTVVCRKQKKFSFFNRRKQSFCGEPRGSERTLFQVCCPGPGSVSKESDSGPPLSFSEGIPGSFSESQLDMLKNPAVPAFDPSLRVRARGGVVSGVPPPWRQFGSGAEVVVVPVSNTSGVCVDAVLTSCGCEKNLVLTVSESLCSVQAAVHAVAGEMKGIIGLPEGLESDSSKHLAEFTAPEFVAVTRATAGSFRTSPSGIDVVSGAGVALCAATVSASSAGET